MNDYFFIGCQGELFDTRKEGWEGKPLREGYKYLFKSIDTLSQVKACLRHGDYSELGGYPVYFITQDGCALSFEAAQAEFKQVACDFIHDMSTGWRIIGCDVNWEDESLTCEHTGKKIPSAYGED